jgi:hypothetical protein
LGLMKSLTPKASKSNYTAFALTIKYWDVLKVTTLPFLLMDKRALVRPIPWAQVAPWA